jgi:hypothetical protein
MSKPSASKNPVIILRRTELAQLSWDEAYTAMIDDLSADQAMRILRCMSNGPKLYETLTSFVENSLGDD